MITNKNPAPLGNTSSVHLKPRVAEVTLRYESMAIERKVFALTLGENVRGRFLRIVEDCGGRRNAVVIPSSGLDKFARRFAEIAEAANDLPLAKSPL
jgi:hypothetical protein